MPSSRKILIIEDDDDLRVTLTGVLVAHGYVVTEARDGDEGLKLFRAAPADLVLTDLIMPNKEGIATIMALRREHPTLGIIAMSGASERAEYLRMAGGLGATRTLQKPFTDVTLCEAIETALAHVS